MGALHDAVRQSDHAKVARLIDQGADLSEWDQAGRSPLVIACEQGDLEMVALLASHKADVFPDEQYRVPLIIATLARNQEMVQILLIHKASPDIVDKRGFSALHHAASTGQLNVLKMLVGAGGNLSARNGCGRSSLAEAAWHGHYEIIDAMTMELTTEERLHVEAIRRFWAGEGKPHSILMHRAAGAKDVDAMRELISGGADVNAKYRGMPPIYHAATRGDMKPVRMLIDAGADPDACDDHGGNALLAALADANKELFVYLWPLCSKATRESCRKHLKKAQAMWPDWKELGLPGL